MTPAALLRAEAVARLEARPGDTLAMATDATSYAGSGKVLLALARPGWAAVWELPLAEYDPMDLVRLGGFTMPAAPALQPTALERAQAKIARVAGNATYVKRR